MSEDVKYIGAPPCFPNKIAVRCRICGAHVPVRSGLSVHPNVTKSGQWESFCGRPHFERRYPVPKIERTGGGPRRRYEIRGRRDGWAVIETATGLEKYWSNSRRAHGNCVSWIQRNRAKEEGVSK